MKDWSWLLAVDPGGTTGWCVMEQGDERPRAYQHKPHEFLEHAHILMQGSVASRGIVVVERFTITQATAKKSAQPEALEQIGAVRYLAKHYAGLDLHMQGPAEVMRLVTDQRLKALGWYVPGQVHANDALRHAATFLAKHNQIRIPT